MNLAALRNTSTAFKSRLTTYRDSPPMREQTVQASSADTPDSSDEESENESDAEETPASPVNSALTENLEPPEPEQLPAGSLRIQRHTVTEATGGRGAKASGIHSKQQEPDQTAAASRSKDGVRYDEGEDSYATRVGTEVTLAPGLIFKICLSCARPEIFPLSRFPHEIFEWAAKRAESGQKPDPFTEHELLDIMWYLRECNLRHNTPNPPTHVECTMICEKCGIKAIVAVPTVRIADYVTELSQRSEGWCPDPCAKHWGLNWILKLEPFYACLHSAPEVLHSSDPMAQATDDVVQEEGSGDEQQDEDQSADEDTEDESDDEDEDEDEADRDGNVNMGQDQGQGVQQRPLPPPETTMAGFKRGFHELMSSLSRKDEAQEEEVHEAGGVKKFKYSSPK